MTAQQAAGSAKGSATAKVNSSTKANGSAKGNHRAERNVGTKGKVDRPMVSTGNPRVTVAFPFSRIDVREPSEALRDLAALVDKLAEQTAAIASQAAPDQAEAADRLAAEAALLAHRLGLAS
jgi:hypothetical protein